MTSSPVLMLGTATSEGRTIEKTAFRVDLVESVRWCNGSTTITMRSGSTIVASGDYDEILESLGWVPA